MASAPAEEMQSICISSYSQPTAYGVAQLPKPVIEADNEVIIKVHAASINPVDVKKAAGMMKMVLKDR